MEKGLEGRKRLEAFREDNDESEPVSSIFLVPVESRLQGPAGFGDF